MRLRANHIIILVLVVVAGVFVAAVALQPGATKAGPAAPGDPEAEFLASVHQAAATASTAQEVGAVPPVGASDTRPVIEVATTHYDIGTIANNKIAKGEVKIRNRGDFDLTIRDISTSCGCTLGSVKNKVIPPGGEEPMEVTVNPFQIADFEATRTLTIQSNDPVNPEVRVDVSCKVEPEFTFDQPTVEFGDVSKGDVVTKQVIVRQAQPSMEEGKDQLLKITKAAAVGVTNGLDVALVPRPESEWEKAGFAEYALDITLDTSKLPPGPVQASYTISTNAPRLPSFGRRINGNVVAPYTLKPRTASLGSVPPGKADAARLTVEAASPVEVSAITLTGEDISVATEPVAGGNGAVIALSVSPNAKPGVKREQLGFDITVGGKTFHETVRVLAMVANGASPAPGPAASAAPVAEEDHAGHDHPQQ